MAPGSTKKTAKPSNQFYARIGKFLRQKRLEAGLSEEEVSSYLGSSTKILRAYETGEKSIPLNSIYALANCLNISPDLVLKRINFKT